MAQEIDISKLHGTLKEYALKCERDKADSKGYGKLNTLYEINLFKEMVIRNGKEAELKKQLPNLQGISTPIKPKTNDSIINKRIIDLMKESDTEENKKDLKNIVSEKLG